MGVGPPRAGLQPGFGQQPGEGGDPGPIEIRYIQYPSEVIFPGRGLYMDWANRYIAQPSTTIFPGTDLFIRSAGGGSTDRTLLLRGNGVSLLRGFRHFARTLSLRGAGRHAVNGAASGPTAEARNYEALRVQLGGVVVKAYLQQPRQRAVLARIKTRMEIQ